MGDFFILEPKQPQDAEIQLAVSDLFAALSRMSTLVIKKTPVNYGRLFSKNWWSFVKHHGPFDKSLGPFVMLIIFDQSICIEIVFAIKPGFQGFRQTCSYCIAVLILLLNTEEHQRTNVIQTT